MRYLLSLLIFSLTGVASYGQRAIPETVDSSAIHLSMTNGAGAWNGSGFYFHDSKFVYLVTARHVLFSDAGTRTNMATSITALSYRKYDDTDKITRTLLVPVLQKNQNLKLHKDHDVAVIRIGEFREEDKAKYKLSEGVKQYGGSPWIIPRNMALGYTDVLLGNEAFVIGYPLSVGRGQLDHERPLLRKGSISGKNPIKKTLILDAAVFKGNSGGPAFQYEDTGGQRAVKLIGVVSETVLIRDQKQSSLYGSVTEIEITNSGYSVIEPIDYVLELLWEK